LRTYFATQARLSMRQLSFDEPRHRAAWYRLTGPVIHSKRPAEESVTKPDAKAALRAAAQAEAGCLLIASSLAGGRAEIEQWVAQRLGWKLACSEVVEIDYPSGNDDALARVATVLPQAPSWLVAVPAPFTAFSAFTQFVARVGQLANGSAEGKGCVV